MAGDRLWCCVTPERVLKSKRIMDAIAAGWPGAQVITGPPRAKYGEAVVWGQIWTAQQVIESFLPEGRGFYQIDNGFYKAASRVGLGGYYRFMYSKPGPVAFPSTSLRSERMRDPELQVNFKPWRKTGRHVLLAMPGLDFGRAFGVDVPAWSASAEARVRAATSRPVLVRDRLSARPLAADLEDAWVVVTHSSNVAVEAVLAGVPVIVSEMSMARPVGTVSLTSIEHPFLPSRYSLQGWWASLMCQQFSIAEMANGTAHRYLTHSSVRTPWDRNHQRAP